MLHGDLLGERARLTPRAEALLELASGRRFTYGELDARTTRTARVLRRVLGLEPGDRFALLSGNRVEFLDCFFAAGRSGVVLVPLNTHLAPPELVRIVRDAGARVLIHERELAGAAHAVAREMELDAVIPIEAGGGGNSLEELAAAAGDGGWEEPPPGPGDLYALLYTSGTTGTPKGVMIPHRVVAWNAYNTVLSWQLRADDVSPIFTPLYHAGGLGAFLTPVIGVGGRLVLHRRFDAAEVWRTIEAEGCTVVLGVPTIWKMLADAPGFETADLSRVRWFISGGAPLPVELVERYRRRGVVLRQGYGLTEVGVNCFAMTDADAWERPGSIGKPLMFTRARIVDREGRELPPGEVGELLLGGPHVTAGYWHNPEATAAAYDPDGFFHTGDLARRDEDGFFYIAGRAKEMFISGGVNIYPAEIEAVLLQYPGVADAAVVGAPDPTWGEVGVAFVVPGKGAEINPDRLVEFLAERLAKYKIPRRFITVSELPRTAYGKVRRHELRDRIATKEDGPGGGHEGGNRPGTERRA